MTTRRTVYLARHINENPEIVPGSFGLGSVVGVNPLDVDDGAAGYVVADWTSPSLYMTQVTFRLQHDGISPVRAGDVTGVYADFAYEVTSTGSILPRINISNTVPPLSRPSVSDNSYPATWTRVEKSMTMPSLEFWNTVDDPSHPWRIACSPGGTFGSYMSVRLTYLRIIVEWAAVEGRLAIDTHDHPFHVVGTRDPAMPYELVIDTGTERLVEIVAGEEALATHELVIDETGRPGTPWSYCGLFRPL